MMAARLDDTSIELLARVAHEMRQPLAAATAALGVIRQIADEQRRSRACSVLEHQCARLTRMVEDLLVFGFKRATLHREPVELAHVVTDVVDAMRPIILDKHLQLEFTVPSEPCWIRADVVRLEQIFSNVLTNAAKYTDAGGRLWARVAADSASATVTIGDTGCGIPPDLLPRVFDMFTTGSDRKHGLGVGLAVARQLVELHGGTIAMSSGGVGCGCEVAVTLPLIGDRAWSAL